MDEWLDRANSKLYLVVSGSKNSISGGNHYNAHLISRLRAVGMMAEIIELTAKVSMENYLSTLEPSDVLIVDSIVADVFCEYYKPNIHHFKLVYLCHLPLSMRKVVDSNDQISQKQKETLLVHEKYLLARADFTITSSRFCQQHLKQINATADIVADIPTINEVLSKAANDRSQDRSNDSATTINILCVSNLLPSKGQLELLEALAKLKHLNWTLRLATGSALTDDAYFTKVKECIANNKLQSRVEVLVDYNGERLVSLYRDADLFVSLTAFETYGMALAEARAFGLPTIVNDVGGVRESTNPERTIYLDTAKNDFFSIISNFLRHPASISDMAKNTRQWISNRDSHHSTLRQGETVQLTEISSKLLCLT